MCMYMCMYMFMYMFMYMYADIARAVPGSKSSKCRGKDMVK